MSYGGTKKRYVVCVCQFRTFLTYVRACVISDIEIGLFDNSVRQKINALRVKCGNTDLGCNWTGLLSEYTAKHQPTECSIVCCPLARYGCTVRRPRADNGGDGSGSGKSGSGGAGGDGGGMKDHLNNDLGAHLLLFDARFDEQQRQMSALSEATNQMRELVPMLAMNQAEVQIWIGQMQNALGLAAPAAGGGVAAIVAQHQQRRAAQQQGRAGGAAAAAGGGGGGGGGGAAQQQQPAQQPQQQLIQQPRDAMDEAEGVVNAVFQANGQVARPAPKPISWIDVSIGLTVTGLAMYGAVAAVRYFMGGSSGGAVPPK